MLFMFIWDKCIHSVFYHENLGLKGQTLGFHRTELEGEPMISAGWKIESPRGVSTRGDISDGIYNNN